MQTLKTAVLSHGRHLQTNGWESIVWGQLPDKLGQVPKAILTAIEFSADIIIFPTGASKDEKTGLLEGEYTLQYAKDHLNELIETGLVNYSLDDLSTYLNRVARLELTSQNTTQELEYSAQICKREDVERIILCSAPTHIERVLRDALVVFAQSPEISFLNRHLLAVASDVSYMGSTPEDVVIIEPPHRGDRPSFPIHKTAARLLPIIQRSPEARHDLEELIRRYEQSD